MKKTRNHRKVKLVVSRVAPSKPQLAVSWAIKKLPKLYGSSLFSHRMANSFNQLPFLDQQELRMGSN